ncbi:MAG: hypothetical protein KIT80_16680 [Chitinophagaceae bacterium]|nr:hypothetical protein [Chitinophagaceae bacterium]MCW5928555.1 hypothetical protein [Chitinophagaceae bacterium]
MKKILSVSLAAIMVIVMASCQSRTKGDEYVPVPAINAAPKVTPANSMGLPINPSVLPVTAQPGIGARPAVNPAHGQPFHDCNLAVGAPFPQAVQPVSPKNSPDVKLNPPHGQPGHRCEIAVGAPLS